LQVSLSVGRQPIDVLVVEDDRDLRDAMVETLRLENYDALGAANGDEALGILREGRLPRVIFLDLRMPVMDGWEFCQVLEENPTLAEIPIAIVSALREPRRLPERRRDAGLFQKPVDLDVLLGTARTYCR
jgi:CheY-like chemotaxis protein